MIEDFTPIAQRDRDGWTIATRSADFAPARLNLDIYRGATFRLAVTWLEASEQRPVDLTMFTAAALTIRASYEATAALVTLTQASGIMLAATQPNIVATISATATAALSGWVQGVYDLTLTDGAGVKTRLCEGFVRLRRGVTT